MSWRNRWPLGIQVHTTQSTAANPRLAATTRDDPRYAGYQDTSDATVASSASAHGFCSLAVSEANAHPGGNSDSTVGGQTITPRSE